MRTTLVVRTFVVRALFVSEIDVRAFVGRAL